MASKPGSRRWYLGMSWGSKVPAPVAGEGDGDRPGLGEHRLGRAAVAMIAAAADGGRRGLGFLGQVMAELGAQGPLG